MKRMNAMKIVLLATLAAAACGSPGERTAVAEATDENDVTVVFDNGEKASGLDEYDAIVAQNPPLVAEGRSFAITVTNPDAGPSVTLGKFKIRFYVSTDYLASCINQKMPHLVVELDYDPSPLPLVQIHLAGWFNGKAPCLGVLNESIIAYGFCLKVCFTNTKDGIKLTLKKTLIAAGVSGVVAGIVANLAAPVAVSALAM